MSDPRSKLRLEGEIAFTLPSGATLQVGWLEFGTAGTLSTPADPFELRLGGKLAQLRRLSEVGTMFATLLSRADAYDGANEAELRLHASEGLLASLQAAGLPPAETYDGKTVLGHEPWVKAAFDLPRYEPVALDLIRRWTKA